MKTFFCACSRLVAHWRKTRQEKRDGTHAAAIGAAGHAVTPLNPRGFVSIAGELWAAQALGFVADGSPVTVVGTDRVWLVVGSCGRDQ
ncbi:MAG: NfeD family protein [Chloracidobacterium sp.]|uniref:NfeD-like C-terminal domain-containing protein n=1 Tax=Chloracidobacterium validum TaxID=2821543 RepID=A0ABX8B693_9BACT|nr:NfeD family protein [Chloracidobacterium validum]QUW02433.1 hypothetical protein J8C06_08730 [Chloracidobacterium validum]